MFGNSPWYNESTRKLTAAFGTLFNDIKIQRYDNDQNLVHTIKVPISYGPRQKFLARLEEDPSLNAPAITLPRMSFVITDMTYDPTRKLGSTLKNTKPVSGSPDVLNTQFTPVPYDVNFELAIMVKNVEDGFKIVEQIVPFFSPAFTVSMKMVESSDVTVDVPIVLNSVTPEDTYEADFLTRRAIIWTLQFTMKAYFYGPVTQRKVIKFVKVNMHTSLESTTPAEQIQIRPGLTANGQPTQVLSETIPYADISEDDPWDYIVEIVEP